MAASTGKSVFTAVELADFKKMFDTYDSDKSGEVIFSCVSKIYYNYSFVVSFLI